MKRIVFEQADRAVAGNVAFTLSQLPFTYSLTRRTVPLGYRILLGIAILGYFPTAMGVIFGNHLSSWLAPLNANINRPITLVVHMALSLAPFLAFRPYAGISRRMRPLAALCMLWGWPILSGSSSSARTHRSFPYPVFSPA